jgi:hypothetical protein
MPDLTIVIPVAPYHSHLAQNAVDSVLAQTMPCHVITVDDKDGRGAGWARNQGLRQVKTEWVSFLDADDTIEPDFAEKCFLILEQVNGQRYVYTNWYEDGRIVVAPSPCDLWTQKTYHLVTTVMRVSDARRIGGYDEHMPGAEDADFGIRLKLSGVCGAHLNAPLLHYRKGGQRSIELRSSGREKDMLLYMTQRYGDYTMGCCGDPAGYDNTPQGEKFDGDVLAQAQWQGNDRKRGLATGRIYARTSFPKICYVNPLDVQAAPHHWKKVSAMPVNQPPVLQPGYQGGQQTGNWQTAAQMAFGGGQAQQMPQSQAPSSDWDYKPVENTRNTEGILKIAQRKK